MRASTLLILLTAATLLTACGPDAETLVVYSGRSRALVDPVIERFRDSTGIRVEVRYGETSQLAVALAEEGLRSAADVFWAQDAGALGSVQARGLLMRLPDSLLARVPEHFRNDAGTWIATSGRARTLAYSSTRVDTSILPQSVLDLPDPRFRNRIGWAPTNGSFQAHVTALRALAGDERTRSWLIAMRNVGARSYANNTAILQAIADGEIDVGLPNHYYLYRFKEQEPGYPVDQRFFEAGDPGNLLNVAGAGVLTSSRQPEKAMRLLAFLLSEDVQKYFANETFEFPVIEAIDVRNPLPSVDGVAPSVDLDVLRDLEGTLQMLRDVGLL